MAKYRCTVCEYIVDEETSEFLWMDLPESWVCPVCGSPRKLFNKVEDLPAPEPDQAVGELPTLPDDGLARG